VVATTIEATSGGALKRGGTNQLCFTMHIYISKAQHNLTGRHNEAPKNEDHILYLCWPAVGCPQRTNKSISFPVPSKVKPKARALVICIHILRQKGLAQPAEAMICANLVSRAYKLELELEKK